MTSLSSAQMTYSDSRYAKSTTSWIASTMSGLITKGLGEHPKQLYRVGRNFVDRAAWANSGKRERSEVSVTAKPLELGFKAGCPIFFDTFRVGSLGLTVGLWAPFSGLTGARAWQGWPIVVPPSSIRTNWIMLAGFQTTSEHDSYCFFDWAFSTPRSPLMCRHPQGPPE